MIVPQRDCFCHKTPEQWSASLIIIECSSVCRADCRSPLQWNEYIATKPKSISVISNLFFYNNCIKAIASVVFILSRWKTIPLNQRHEQTRADRKHKFSTVHAFADSGRMKQSKCTLVILLWSDMQIHQIWPCCLNLALLSSRSYPGFYECNLVQVASSNWGIRLEQIFVFHLFSGTCADLNKAGHL